AKRFQRPSGGEVPSPHGEVPARHSSAAKRFQRSSGGLREAPFQAMDVPCRAGESRSCHFM
ncbi:MAG: hypothetical protein VXZ13_17160, partial [Pseudomonadota bacterium]|nr:hypothetical protein [Pseudomonadota bacterium]